MIQLSAALAINNATAVELEATRGADGHADRLLGDSLHQSCLIILWHILIPINGHHIPVRQNTDDQLPGILLNVGVHAGEKRLRC